MALLFLGDFLYDYDDAQKDIDEISNWIKSNGYKVILNLEGPITTDFSQKRKKRGPNLCQGSKAIEILKDLQVIGVCLSNNHIMDFGENGLEDTIKALDENNILHTGGGRNLSAAAKPMRIKDNDNFYEIYNFGWHLEETVYAEKGKAGCSPREEKHILNCIRNVGNKECKKIAVMHWGFEYNYLPMPFDIELAHKMIDAGFDMVIGHHPHVVQPMEVYKGKNIYYSIGNFFMGTRRKAFHDRLKNETLGQGILLDGQCCALYDVIYNAHGTKICENTCPRDITGVNFQSKAYIKNCKENSQNYTPILNTKNKFMSNFIKINCLKALYAAYSVVRPLRRR